MPRQSTILAALALALTGGAGLALPGAALARGEATPAVAQLAAPAQTAEAIAGGVLWKCEGTTCVAPQPGERPLRVCRELARKVGTIVQFEMGGEALDADKLARCNA